MKGSLTENRYLAMLETAFGSDILEFMQDDQVIEIMLNPDGKLWVERLFKGKVDTGMEIPSERSENIIKLVASYKNDIANADVPSVSTELPLQAARFQGWLPPVVSRPTFAIRKHAKIIFTLDDYQKAGSISASQRKYLEKSIQDRKNIIIVGGTSSGKTTFANALLQVLSDSPDRVLVLEDLPELQVNVPDCVNMTATDVVSMRDLVRGCLRMRPDRIIIGEVRDGAALELLKAWNTGHPGGLCTIHANSAESTPLRIEDLIQEVVVTVPRNLILQAIDLIVYIERDKKGLRKIKSINELQGFNGKEYVVKAVK